MKKGLVSVLVATMSAKLAAGEYAAGSVMVEQTDGTWAVGDAETGKRAGILLDDHNTTTDGDTTTVGVGVFNKHMVGVTDVAKLAALQEKGIYLNEGQN